MQFGGIISLVELNESTDGALNADLMRIMGAPLSMCHVYGWENIADVARHLDQGSAVFRAINPDYAITDAMLYDAVLLISDCIARLNHNYVRSHGGKGSAPKPVERPWRKSKTRRIGSGAIPVSEFERWYYGG